MISELMSEQRLLLYAACPGGSPIADQPLPVDIVAAVTLTKEVLHSRPARTARPSRPSPGRYLPESNAIHVYIARGTHYQPEAAFEIGEVVRLVIYEQTDVVPTVGGLRSRLPVGQLKASNPDAIRRRNGALEVVVLLEDHPSAYESFVGGRYTIADTGRRRRVCGANGEQGARRGDEVGQRATHRNVGN
jgi:hypothetical protein